MPDLTEDDLPRYAPPRAKGGFVPEVKTEDDLPRYDASKALPDTVEHGGRPVVNLYVPKGEAFGRGAIDAGTFGAAPVISGLSAAGATAPEPLPMVGEFPGLEIPAYGAVRLSRGDEEARRAYEQERSDMAAKRAASFEQHPGYALGGELAGGMLTPGFGGMAAGTTAARIGSGIAGGAIGGGLYGAGSAVGEGGGPQEALRSAATGAGFGAATGGVFGGAFGPRVRAPNVALERAAQTAEELKAPLARGVAGPPWVQQLAGAMRSVPGIGTRIGAGLLKTQEAAGERVGEIAGGMAPAGRDIADEAVRSGLMASIEHNKETADQLYAGLHGRMPRQAPVDLKQTEMTLANIVNRRSAARQSNPKSGLEQVQNAIDHPEAISFQGARDLRADVRRSGSLNPHPDLAERDYNRLTQAITADMKVAAARHGALPEFTQAESRFGVIAEQDKQLHKILRSTDERAISKLIGAAQKDSGSVRMLQQLRQIMPPEYFQAIGGQILHEIGKTRATGDFSLAKFTTDWNALSNPAKVALFSPGHLRALDDIFNLGKQTKTSMAATHANHSHTATPVILFELAQHVADAVAEGKVFKAAGTIALAPASLIFTHWLTSPQKAQAISTWGKALQQVSINPARVAGFNIATRNMAHTLGIPVDRILSTAGISVDERNNQ